MTTLITARLRRVSLVTHTENSEELIFLLLFFFSSSSTSFVSFDSTCDERTLVRLSNLCCWKLYYYIYRPNDVSHDNYLLYLRVQFTMRHIWWSSLKLWMCDSAHFTFPMALPSSPKMRSPYFKDQVSCSIHKSATILDITSHRRRSCTESRRLRVYHRSYMAIYSRDSKRGRRGGAGGPCPMIDSFPVSVLHGGCRNDDIMLKTHLPLPVSTWRANNQEVAGDLLLFASSKFAIETARARRLLQIHQRCRL